MPRSTMTDEEFKSFLENLPDDRESVASVKASVDELKKAHGEKWLESLEKLIERQDEEEKKNFVIESVDELIHIYIRLHESLSTDFDHIENIEKLKKAIKKTRNEEPKDMDIKKAIFRKMKKSEALIIKIRMHFAKNEICFPQETEDASIELIERIRSLEAELCENS